MDVWALAEKKLLGTVQGSDVAALSHDGSLFATGEIAIYDTRSRSSSVGTSGMLTEART